MQNLVSIILEINLLLFVICDRIVVHVFRVPLSFGVAKLLNFLNYDIAASFLVVEKRIDYEIIRKIMNISILKKPLRCNLTKSIRTYFGTGKNPNHLFGGELKQLPLTDTRRYLIPNNLVFTKKLFHSSINRSVGEVVTQIRVNLQPSVSSVFVIRRTVSTRSILDVDTDVKKDVLLYELETNFFRLLNYLLALQLVLWLTFGYLFTKIRKFFNDEEVIVFGLFDVNDKRWKIVVPTSFIVTGNTICYALRI